MKTDILILYKTDISIPFLVVSQMLFIFILEIYLLGKDDVSLFDILNQKN